MGALNTANIKKMIYYLQRNGLKNTWYAVRERMAQSREAPYVYQGPSVEELAGQRAKVKAAGACQGIDFSIVVPLYRTKPVFLKELIESIQSQTYPYWEVLLADATEDDSVWEVVSGYEGVQQMQNMECGHGVQQMQNMECGHGVRQMQNMECGHGVSADAETDRESADYGIIRYMHLESNEGISANTNAALPYAKMNYIGLLDHDDILTPDALFEMAQTILQAKEQGREPELVYSDEDKCNGGATEYYEPNFKEDFNYDLILSNNYICHFLIMKRELMQKLQFRPEYDGAQDYDLVLRAVTELGIPSNPDRETLVAHVPRVLYHWRCHASSTAENPRSKQYAYEAGRRALQSHIEMNHIPGQVLHLKHVGFYRVEYPADIFAARKDIGAVGSALIRKGKIVSGRMDEEGNVYYRGLSEHFSGYLHRAVLGQSAEVIDIRSMVVRKELRDLFARTTGVDYRTIPGTQIFDASILPQGTNYKELSIRLSKEIRRQGYRLQWYRRDNG